MADIKSLLQALAPTIAECAQETKEFKSGFRKEAVALGEQFIQLQPQLENSFEQIKRLMTEINEFQQTFDRIIIEHIEKQSKYSTDIDTIPETLISGPSIK